MRRSLFTILFVIVLSLFYSCEQRLSWQQSINKNYGQIIDFDWNKQFILQDTVLKNDECLRVPIKIVSAIDDGVCDSCLVNYLTGASMFMEEIQSDSVILLAIVKHRSEEQMRGVMKKIESKRCVIVQDIDDKYCGNNDLKKRNVSFRVFLLDTYNRIILCGDPLLSYKLEKLYANTINDLIGRGGVLEGECDEDVSFVKLRSNIINVGKINVNNEVPFSVYLRNTNRRPIRVEIESQCDCTVVDQETLEMEPGSRATIKGSVVVEKEGAFIKYLFIRMADKEEFQTVEIKGIAANN